MTNIRNLLSLSTINFSTPKSWCVKIMSERVYPVEQLAARQLTMATYDY